MDRQKCNIAAYKRAAIKGVVGLESQILSLVVDETDRTSCTVDIVYLFTFNCLFNLEFNLYEITVYIGSFLSFATSDKHRRRN